MSKRVRRTKAQMEEYRKSLQNDEDWVDVPDSKKTRSDSVSNFSEDKNKSEEVDKDEEENTLEDAKKYKAHFIISDGKDEVLVKAEANCWSMSWKVYEYAKDDIKKLNPIGFRWESRKWVTDLGCVASRIFDLRLKACNTRTLEGLSKMATQIRDDVRKEFKL